MSLGPLLCLWDPPQATETAQMLGRGMKEKRRLKLDVARNQWSVLKTWLVDGNGVKMVQKLLCPVDEINHCSWSFWSNSSPFLTEK